MTERKNVQTEHKWVGEIPDRAGAVRFWHQGVDDGLHMMTTGLDAAHPYDSPTDVPDDCTPVRVRVTTWEEEGEPERMSDQVDGWQIVGLMTGEPAGYEIMTDADDVMEIISGSLLTSGSFLTAIPVRIPTETKREVVLDPEEWDPDIERSPGDWRPIETAPRPGGESVLVFSEGFRVHVAHRCATATDPDKWADHDGYLPVKPTHWMPLPEPPGVKADPEPAETGCRCRGEMEERLERWGRIPSVPWVSEDYTRGVHNTLQAMREALADCDCKARETVQ